MKIFKLKALSLLVMLLMLSSLASATDNPTSVPGGTRMELKLKTGISSKTSRSGDKFTATVVSPSKYAGSIVEGHISKVKESGRVKGRTEMSLEFDSIEFRDGGSAPLRAELLEIRQSDSVKTVDEEGNVQSGSRGNQAIKRGAAGAAIGGVLGGLIGGGKGALVGVLIGGGGGVGSLIIDGKKELKLESGAEMQIRTLSSAARSSRRPSTKKR